MKKIIALVLAIAMIACLFVGCGSTKTPGNDSKEPDTTNGESKNGTPDTGERKSILFFTAFIGDFGLSDMGHRAVKEISEEYNMDFTLVEYGSYDAALAVNSFWDALETKKYDYFFGPDWYIADVLNDAAAQYPDTTFILYDTGLTSNYEGNNIYGISFAQNEGAFVAALLQALTTKVGKIGVLSTDSPILNDFSTGWLAGARYAQKEMGLDVDYLHAYLTETSMSAVYESMNVMYNNGCDVVWPISAQMMLAAAQAAEEHGGYENGYYVMGCDYDQYSYFKSMADEGSESAVGYENVITSITKNIGACTKMIVESVESGSGAIPTGNRLYGVAEGGVGILENEHYLEVIPQEVRDRLAEVIAKIGTGEIDVPSYFDFETYEDFAAFRDRG